MRSTRGKQVLIYIRNILCLIILSIFNLAYCFELNEVIEIKDYNEDGFKDTLNKFISHGSGFGGQSYSIINGKTKEVYKLGLWSSHGNLRNMFPIPPDLNKKENEFFLRRIMIELLPPKKEVADPSLKWIINANLSHSYFDDNSAFDLVLFPSNDWVKGLPVHPKRYYLEMEQENFSVMYNTNEDKPKWYDDEKDNGYLIYYGLEPIEIDQYNSLGTNSVKDSNGFYRIQNNDIYTVLKTSHGIIVQKEDTYKWVFVTDKPLTKSPSRLRYNSIGSVVLLDSCIIFQHVLLPSQSNQLFIIDIEAGICARFRENAANFKIDNDTLILVIIEEDEEITYELQELIDQLSFLKAKN